MHANTDIKPSSGDKASSKSFQYIKSSAFSFVISLCLGHLALMALSF
jgi:hypothetical protein